MTSLPEIRSPDRFFIGGRWIKPSSDTKLPVVTPSTEELYLEVAEAAADDVDLAVAAARRAFDDGPWPRMSPAERAVYLRDIGKAIAARSGMLADMWTSEMGVLRTIAGSVIPAVGGVWDYYASLAATFEFVERHAGSYTRKVELLVREPVGVVAAILPWNGPLPCIAWKLAPALLAGCTVILKSAPEGPGSALVMAEIFESVGLPPGVVNVLTADRNVSEMLVRHPGVDKVTFTGSSAVGKKIGSICAERVARCTLELGGKSAAVILDDYDLEMAANSLTGAARMLSGQRCAALTRVVVGRNRQKALLEAMAAIFGALRVGDPFAAETDMGPLAFSRQRDRVEQFIASGLAEGATLVTGGGRPSHLNRGFYVEPTVFGDVDSSMTVAQQEIFGPVICVIPADSDQQAVDIANDSVFGLNASVFTNDTRRAYAISRRLRSGTVGHNGDFTDMKIAFGGFKQSGIGREGGVEGLRSFLETKVVVLDEGPVDLTASSAT